ncbi:MAG TPA: alcohol dehydrogenase catalytic domain-containing protein, partial [Streptosporangiaceae bacterium]
MASPRHAAQRSRPTPSKTAEVKRQAEAVLGFEAAGVVDAVGPGVTGTSAGDGVTALLFSLGGYAEYAVASIWA